MRSALADPQCQTPALRCPWCGEGLYAGAEVRLGPAGPIHEDCFDDYALERWPRAVLER